MRGIPVRIEVGPKDIELSLIHIQMCIRDRGANIQVESNIAIINGIEQFSGTSVTVPDLRAGAALVIAGLAAQGVSVLEDIVYIKRGYEDFAEKLTSLGGIIEEVETEKDIQRFRLKNGTTNW